MTKKNSPIYFIRLFICCSVIFVFTTTGCKPKETALHQKITIPVSMLDSIKKASDSNYVKPYFTHDFTRAEYYVNKKDSTLTQIMKDKDSVIRQVISTKNKIRIFTAQYFSNGQLVAKYQLDKFGQYEGYSEEYYESGYLKSTGVYKGGFHSGKWKNYDVAGKYISTDEYNGDGQQIKN
ncbi:MAG: hypothetical protein ABJA37_12480 [Ferruginibacter sp.]